jgi:hypothetical protein
MVMLTINSIELAEAKTLQLACENPRREYLVKYQEGAREILLNPDTENSGLRVLAVENTTDKYVVAAQTPNGGPAVRLHLRPYLKIEYWVDGQLFQTDGCYKK